MSGKPTTRAVLLLVSVELSQHVEQRAPERPRVAVPEPRRHRRGELGRDRDTVSRIGLFRAIR